MYHSKIVFCSTVIAGSQLQKKILEYYSGLLFPPGSTEWMAFLRLINKMTPENKRNSHLIPPDRSCWKYLAAQENCF